MTSTLELLIPKPLVNQEELANVLESLPSYESLNQTSDEPAVFDEEKEPSSGLIEQIRHNSQSEEPGSIPSPIVRLKKKRMLRLIFMFVLCLRMISKIRLKPV